MVEHIQGELLAGNASFALVVSRFNEAITGALLQGAVETLRRHGADEDRIAVVWVPGSMEIPLAARELARQGRYDALCCLGVIIQGETPHHEYISQQVAGGMMQVGQATGVPVGFGVLTCQTPQQAWDRAGGKAGNKGREAALAAIEMVNLLKRLAEETR